MEASPYSQLVETASRLADVELLESVDHENVDEAIKLLERIRPILDSTRNIELPKCCVPVRYEADFFAHHMDDFQNLRPLAQAFRLASDVAAFHSDYEAVARYGIAILDVANAVRRGGLIVDHLVAVALAGVGVEGLRSVREHFSDDTRRELIKALLRCESEREPFVEIAARDAKWEAESGCEENGSEISEDELIDPDSELPVEDQRALIRIIKEMAHQPESDKQAMYDQHERHDLANTRLLMVDLALRCWNHHNGRYPKSLAELSPEILIDIPHDPFTDRDFIYRLSQTTFVLYSTGPDQADCGGNFGPRYAIFCGGFDLSLDSEDYSSRCCSIPTVPGLARRIWSRFRFWRREPARPLFCRAPLTRMK